MITAASTGRLDHTLAVLAVLSSAVDMRPHLVEPELDVWVLSPEGRSSIRPVRGWCHVLVDAVRRFCHRLSRGLRLGACRGRARSLLIVGTEQPYRPGGARDDQRVAGRGARARAEGSGRGSRSRKLAVRSKIWCVHADEGHDAHMNRFTQSSILVFSGLALLLAVVSAAFDWRLALGAAAVAGACAVWAALMSTAGSQPSAQVCAQPAGIPVSHRHLRRGPAFP